MAFIAFRSFSFFCPSLEMWSVHVSRGPPSAAPGIHTQTGDRTTSVLNGILYRRKVLSHSLIPLVFSSSTSYFIPSVILLHCLSGPYKCLDSRCFSISIFPITERVVGNIYYYWKAPTFPFLLTTVSRYVCFSSVSYISPFRNCYSFLHRSNVNNFKKIAFPVIKNYVFDLIHKIEFFFFLFFFVSSEFTLVKSLKDSYLNHRL